MIVKVRCLEQQRAHATHFGLFLNENLKVLVDDRHSQQDTRTGANGAQEISHNRQCANAKTTKSSSRWNITIQFMNHGVLAMTAHDHVLLLQLLGNLTEQIGKICINYIQIN